MADREGRPSDHDRRGVRAAIKRDLRSMFASVPVSLSEELIADRRIATHTDDGSVPVNRPKDG
jgi:hypothetical protein